MEQERITIATFHDRSLLALVEAHLREAGVAHWLLDEITVQVAPHLGPAVGGIRLQVALADRERAAAIIRELGVEEDRPAGGSIMLEAFNSRTRGLPLIGRLRVEWRLMLVGATGLGLISALVYLTLAPTRSEMLQAHEWCVAGMEAEGAPLAPNTTGPAFRFVMAGCPERIRFHNDGRVLLPGIDTDEVEATWRLEGKWLVIEAATDLPHLYNGVYAFRVDGNRLALRSKRISVRCGRDVTVENLFRGLH
ncbi:MAG: hypothetical protein RBT71_12205 [Flavobacteriales bacterium]|jgi:hypothetical protein|nr:hypothetical protein [Flavobacteriales bacterium]